jgi:hypothetical protein
MGVRCQRHAFGKWPPVPIEQEAGYTLEPVWIQRVEDKSFALAKDQTLVVQSIVGHCTDFHHAGICIIVLLVLCSRVNRHLIFNGIIPFLCEVSRSSNKDEMGCLVVPFFPSSTILLRSYSKCGDDDDNDVDDDLVNGVWIAATNGPIVHLQGDIWAWRTMVEWRCKQRNTPDLSARALW